MTQNQNSEPTATEPTQNSNVISSERPPCDLLFFNSANQFAESMIQNIPELQAVAIVPMFAPKLQNVPNGLMRLRSEQAPYIAGLLQMLTNLSAFSADVHRDLIAQTKAFDQFAHDLAATVQQRMTELDALNQQMNQKTGKSEQ